MVICIKVPTFFKHNISSIASVNFYCPRCDFERFKFDKCDFFVELDSFPNDKVRFFKEGHKTLTKSLNWFEIYLVSVKSTV